MQGDKFRAKEVLACGDAAGNGEGHLALVGDEGVDGPFLCRRVVSVLVDLEPLQARDGCLGRVWDLCAIGQRR